MADDEQRVRQLAYRIWESEGRPDGQAQRHWDMAWKIVAAERAAGNEAELDALDVPHDEAPILEEDLPLEEDEVGIQENRLPLDDPDGEPGLEESPYRDDLAADAPGEEVPVHDRGSDTPSSVPDTSSTPSPTAPRKARATKASSRAPAKAAPKTVSKTGAKTATSKAGASTRKSPAAQKASKSETMKTEASKTRTRSSPRDKTPKPGDKPGEE